MNIEPVELRPAFEWTCPECGTNHYASGIVVESPDTQAELTEEYGGDEDQDGRWMMMPDNVTCPHCSTNWKTKHFSDEDNFEDEA